MKEELSKPSCARALDLVTYLYGEANEREAADFKRHLEACAACRSELSAFACARESVGQWKHQSLGAFVTSKANAETNDSVEVAANTQARRRSALTALRQFFSLSPLWMQGATALATLAFVALIIIAAIHFRGTQVDTASVPAVQQRVYSEQQVKQIVADARREEREAINRGTNQTSESAYNPVATNLPPRRVSRASFRRPVLTANRKSVRPLSPSEFNEIVRGDRMTAETDEDRLPRLSDLLRDTNGSN